MSSKKVIRMPPLRVLRVKNPNKQDGNPCMPIMSSVLACWASAGYATAGCAAVEQTLRNCMDGPKPEPKRKNNINFHLSRFKKYMEGPTSPTKKKK